MLKWITAAACLCPIMVQAQPSTLSGQQIGDLVSGATVEIDTPIGTKLPVRYGRDGRISGEAGGLASYLGSASDKGRWWVASDRLCHKWNRWFGSEPQCMLLSKAGRVIHWRSEDGYTGTAVISAPPIIQAEAGQAPAQPVRSDRVDPSEIASAPANAHEERVGAAKETDPPSSPPTGEAAAPSSPAKPASAKEPPAQAPPVRAAATPSASPPPQPQAQPKRAPQPMFRVVNVRSDDVLNVRSGPSADFDIVGGLPPGSRGVAITTACRASWCQVRHGSTSGWVNTVYLAPEEPSAPAPRYRSSSVRADAASGPGFRDASDTARACLTAPAHALLARIEQQFGPVQVVSTCRVGTSIPVTRHSSRHATGNAVDFLAGSRKTAIVEWLIANHRDGGTMTYTGTDRVHVDIGPHFVSIANGPRWLSWRDSSRDFPRTAAARDGVN